jgi:hypothetical protein
MATAASPAGQLSSFIAKFDPPMQKRIKAVRAAVRKRMPTANELVYDNYNFFVIGYSSSERPSDAIVSIVANAKGVSMCFIYGASLPDPDGILQGGGNQTRFVRLASAATLSEAPIARVLRAAIADADPRLPAKGGGKLIIRLIAPKQRPRR